MPAEMMPGIFQDYLDHHEPPSKLLVEVSCIGRENEPGSLERFTVLLPQSKSTAGLIARTHPKTYWYCQLSHLYRFNSELTWRSLFFLRKTDQDWIMDGEVAPDWNDHYPKSRFREFTRSDGDAKAIAKLIDIASQSGIEVELILAPYLPEYYDQLEPNDAWLAWLEERLGQKVTDYSSVIKTRESFADPIHLNPRGAETFANFLQEQGKL